MRQDRIRRPAIDSEAAGPLIGADDFAGIGADFTVDLVDLIATGFEAGLNFLDCFGSKLWIVDGFNSSCKKKDKFC